MQLLPTTTVKKHLRSTSDHRRGRTGSECLYLGRLPAGGALFCAEQDRVFPRSRYTFSATTFGCAPSAACPLGRDCPQIAVVFGGLCRPVALHIPALVSIMWVMVGGRPRASILGRPVHRQGGHRRDGLMGESSRARWRGRMAYPWSPCGVSRNRRAADEG